MGNKTKIIEQHVVWKVINLVLFLFESIGLKKKIYYGHVKVW